MNDFTASNGATVETITSGRVIVRDATPFEYADGTTRAGQSSYLDPGQFVALREFFQAEADERLGRWRWPGNPDYVAILVVEHVVRVLRESDATTWQFSRGDNMGLVIEDDTHPCHRVARAYFDAHPEPKLAWNDAKDGEVWVLTVNGVDDAWAFRVREWERVSDGSLLRGAPLSPGITAGRRIYPEVVAS